MIRGVLFHFDALNVSTAHPKRLELEDLLRHLATQGVKTAVLTTKPLGVNTRLLALGLPPIDHEVTSKEVGVGKGSPKWIAKACELMGIDSHELLYIGGSNLDWRTAINTPVFYIQGAWSSPIATGVTSYWTDSPREVITLIELFFNRQPSYAFSMDSKDGRKFVRCMLPHNVSLQGDSGSFSLQDLLTYDQDHSVNGNDARHVLQLSLLVSLYSEGLLRRQDGELPPVFTIFPSSNPANSDSHFDDFMQLVAKSFHGGYVPDLLERHTPALDTSIERVTARKEGRQPNVGVLTHANTVRLNPSRKTRLADRLVVVLDDFCNTGLSLDWARLLLDQAGVKRMVLASVGKYSGDRYDVYIPAPQLSVDPYAKFQYGIADFTQYRYKLSPTTSAATDMQSLFNAISKGSPYPITDL